jgi:uracil-DNA glycosylase family 4
VAVTDDTTEQLSRINDRVIRCRRCPRLVRYLAEIRREHDDFWCRPVPGFGDANARILLLGLAPGRGGSNRTGRMFTGDASGAFLFAALHRWGLASAPLPVDREDGLRLRDAYITAVVRCAPPKNRPTPEEIRRCLPFAGEEIRALRNLRVVVALGRIAHDGYLRWIDRRLSAHPFGHGAVHRPPDAIPLIDSYHPSRQNTQTGRLTEAMFDRVLREAVRLASS